MKNFFGSLKSSPYLLVILAPFVLFAPVFLASRAIFWGTPLTQFVPWWYQAWETLKSGHIPLWNPLNGMGAPLLANYQSGLLYPPNWTYFLLAATGGLPLMAWGQALLVAAHLTWAGLGMSKVARRLGWGELAQTVVGLAFGLSAYLVARSHFLSINAAVAWLPWILLAAFDLARGGRPRRDIPLLALVTAMQLLAGHAQIAWYTLLFTAALTCFWGWERARWRGMVRAMGLFGVASLLALGLAAAQLLPTAEYLVQSQRAAAVDVAFALDYSFWPWRLLTLLAPNLFGNPANGDYWGYGAFWEDAVYVGLLPFLLAAAAILRRKKAGPEKRLVWFLAGVSLIALILALGRNSLVFPWLYRNIPTFDMFQAPTRFTVWAVAALSLLAGFGVQSWKRPEGRALYWSRLALAGAAAVSLGAGIGWYLLGRTQADFGSISPTFIPALVMAGVIGLGAAILNLLAPPAGTERAPKVWAWAVALFVSGDLVIAGWGLNPGTDLVLYQEPNAMIDRYRIPLGEGRLYLPPEDERSLKFERFLRFDTFSVDEDWSNLRIIALPNTNILERIPSANNFDPILPARYAAWMDTLAQAPNDLQTLMLSWMNVSVVEWEDERMFLGVRFEEMDPAGKVRWSPCGEFVSDPDLSKLIAQMMDNPEVAFLEGVRDIEEKTCNPNSSAETRIVSENPNQLSIDVKASEDGYLVLADTWYPGWQASVDGEWAEIFRADYLFRAVWLPEGTHEVLFVYRPISWYIGGGLSFLSWFGLGLFWMLQKRRDG